MEQLAKPEKKEGKLLLMCVLYILFQFTGILFDTLSGDGFSLRWVLSCIIESAIAILLYVSYKNHTKNVMKPLVGAALMFLMLGSLEYAAYYLQYFGELDTWGYNVTLITTYALIYIAIFVVLALINIMHYLINTSHESRPKKIKINKVLFVIYVILLIASCVVNCFFGDTVYYIIGLIFSVLADLFFLNMVITVESSLDEFRIYRETAAGTETEEIEAETPAEETTKAKIDTITAEPAPVETEE